jgi:hypothetical protein
MLRCFRIARRGDGWLQISVMPVCLEFRVTRAVKSSLAYFPLVAQSVNLVQVVVS